MSCFVNILLKNAQNTKIETLGKNIFFLITKMNIPEIVLPITVEVTPEIIIDLMVRILIAETETGTNGIWIRTEVINNKTTITDKTDKNNN